ncbi:MAG: HAMP domain-containing histidine kinase [Deltaproteobacteria bacterium]|nr:HAMP domain-containing histidine kinase [Deltaproteobacteria bacterium]
MFLDLPNRPAKSIKTKLSILFTGLFIASSLALFTIMYAFIASTWKNHDREILLTELKELETSYNNGGFRSMESVIESKRKYHQQHQLYVRIADSNNRTRKEYLPTPWMEFNVRSLEEHIPTTQPKWIRLPSIDGGSFLEVTSSPMTDGSWLQVGMSTVERENVLDRLSSTFWIVIGPLVLFGFICAWLLSFFVLRPIRNLLLAVKSVQTGSMDAMVPVNGTGDELDELADHFNRMLRKIAAVLQAMKECLDNVAHDLRTPVTRLRNLAENALQAPENKISRQEALGSCVEETERIMAMLNTLLDISEAESGMMRLEYKEIQIDKLVANIVDAYAIIADDKSLQIRFEGEPALAARLDPNRMSQVLGNLLDNAIKYTPAGGKIDVDYFQEPGWIVIQVRDNGSGIAPAELPRIWERLYRGRQSRFHKGIGLGLSQVKAIVEAHNGRVTVSSEPDRGSVFTIRIPAACSA